MNDEMSHRGLTVSLAQLRPSSVYWHVEMAKLEQFLGDVAAWGEQRPIPLLKLIDGRLPLKLVLWCLSQTPQGRARDHVARAFAADCAEHVLPVFAAACSGDERPAAAIDAARVAADSGDSSGLEAAGRAAMAASMMLRSEGLAKCETDPADGKCLVRAATAAEVAADCCKADAGEAAYSAPIRAATYLFGREPGLPMGPAWERETAWQTQCLYRHLASA